jgi:hypothetical protein
MFARIFKSANDAIDCLLMRAFKLPLFAQVICSLALVALLIWCMSLGIFSKGPMAHMR